MSKKSRQLLYTCFGDCEQLEQDIKQKIGGLFDLEDGKTDSLIKKNLMKIAEPMIQAEIRKYLKPLIPKMVAEEMQKFGLSKTPVSTQKPRPYNFITLSPKNDLYSPKQIISMLHKFHQELYSKTKCIESIIYVIEVGNSDNIHSHCITKWNHGMKKEKGEFERMIKAKKTIKENTINWLLNGKKTKTTKGYDCFDEDLARDKLRYILNKNDEHSSTQQKKNDAITKTQIFRDKYNLRTSYTIGAKNTWEFAPIGGSGKNHAIEMFNEYSNIMLNESLNEQKQFEQK